MNPNTSPYLFADVAKPSLARVVEEQNRRAVVSRLMGELDTQFDQLNKLGYISDPLIYARLFAIRVIQYSELGLSGFDPLETIDQNNGGTTQGFAAPAHDTYRHDDGLVYKTRTVKFEMQNNGYRDESHIVIIGLNFYLGDEHDQLDELGTGVVRKSGLLVATTSGEQATIAGDPITGDISVFTVYNSKTKDAKIYKVTQMETGTSEVVFGPEKSVTFNGNTAHVLLPNGTKMLVEELRGVQMHELMAEFDSSIDTLKELGRDMPQFTDEEIAAVRHVSYGA